MTKAKITDYSVTAASNTDVQDISLAEGWLPATVNNMFRAFLAHVANAANGVSGWLTLQNTITAGTTQTQAGATAITGPLARVTTCANANDGVKLPTCAAEVMITVMNLGATNLQVWPNTSDTVNGGSANAVDAYVVPPNTSRTYLGLDATDWRAVPFNGGVTGSPVQTATSGVIETDGTYVAVCKFGPALDGVNWDEKTSAPTAKVMLATIKDAGADTTVEIWSGTISPIAGSAALASVTLTGAATPTSIAASMGYIIVGSEDGIAIIDPHSGSWAERTAGWPKSLSTSTAPALTNNDVGGVAAGFSGQPAHDPRTGGPMPTFACSYGAGADIGSVIKDDGNVFDRAGTVDNPAICLLQNGKVAFGNSSGDRIDISQPPITAITADDWSIADVGSTAASQSIPGLGFQNAVAGEGNLTVGASATGLSSYLGVVPPAAHANIANIPQNAGSAKITRAYNTGYMMPNIRGAWLANSKTVDYSGRSNTLTENGTVTEGAVNSGDLLGYSGFSISNFLQRGIDTDFDFGTGDFAVMCWFKSDGFAAAGESIWHYATAAYANAYAQILGLSGGTVRMIISDGTGSDAVATTETFDDNKWHFIVAGSFGGGATNEIWIDGVQQVTAARAEGSISNTSALTTIGEDPRHGASTSPWGGSLTLFRIGATAPSAAQIRAMYEAEKPMFESGALCLLQSATTDAVLDVDIDAITGFVTVVQTDDETVWKGLAIHSEPTIPTGGTTWEHSVRHAGAAFTITDANFAGNVPAIAVRDVASDVQGLMGKLPAGVDLSKAKAWIKFEGDGSPQIWSSYNIEKIVVNGTGDFQVHFGIPFKTNEYVSTICHETYVGTAKTLNTSNKFARALCYNTSNALADCDDVQMLFFGELENE